MIFNEWGMLPYDPDDNEIHRICQNRFQELLKNGCTVVELRAYAQHLSTTIINAASENILRHNMTIRKAMRKGTHYDPLLGLWFSGPYV